MVFSQTLGRVMITSAHELTYNDSVRMEEILWK